MLKDFSKADQTWLGDMLAGISDGAPHLADGDNGRFQNAVALQVNPGRSSKTHNEAAKPAANTSGSTKQNAAQEPEGDTRSPMQKLLDKFK